MHAYIICERRLFMVMLPFFKQCIPFGSNWVQNMLVGKRMIFCYIRADGSILLSYDKIKSFVLY